MTCDKCGCTIMWDCECDLPLSDSDPISAPGGEAIIPSEDTPVFCRVCGTEVPDGEFGDCPVCDAIPEDDEPDCPVCGDGYLEPITFGPAGLRCGHCGWVQLA